VIYTHNIANTRIGGISRRNLKMFQKLVGSDCLKNVVVVTTMWGTVEKDMGERREAELKSKDTLFKPLLDAGARIFRHDSGSKSAHKIIDIVSGNEPKELLIQVELSKGANLVDTTAGAELVAEFGRFDEEDRKKLRSLDRELNEAMEEKDEALVAELMRTRAKLEGWMRSREQDRAKLAQNVYSLGPVLGARAGHRITGLKKSGAVVGAVAAIAGVGLLAAGEVIEKCVGIPKERGVAKQVPAYIEIVEQKAGRFATKGEKALGQPGALAGGALGAAVGVAACVFKGLGHIAENA
jgi:hypothetical protein